MIDSYSFGSIEINSEHYTKDLIILPDSTILHPWWRNKGHKLSLTDIQDIINSSPDILVVGTGTPGLMKPDRNLLNDLKTIGIETRIMSTKKAVREYNALRKKGKNVAGCFHLTC